MLRQLPTGALSRTRWRCKITLLSFALWGLFAGFYWTWGEELFAVEGSEMSARVTRHRKQLNPGQQVRAAVCGDALVFDS